MAMSGTNIVLIVWRVLFLVLYLLRRRTRLGRDDE